MSLYEFPKCPHGQEQRSCHICEAAAAGDVPYDMLSELKKAMALPERTQTVSDCPYLRDEGHVAHRCPHCSVEPVRVDKEESDDPSPFWLVQRLRAEATYHVGDRLRSKADFFMFDLLREAARMIERRVVAAPSRGTNKRIETPPIIDRDWWLKQGADFCIDRMVVMETQRIVLQRKLEEAKAHAEYEENRANGAIKEMLGTRSSRAGGEDK